ncbi:MAG: tRNA uridine-5-carboxymethylaminomethyl(34) synthesis GTPase MnmE, partial [Deltaproteobacteria bacterium]|nr:tRNA uridine-5-carboxymethylaminomethyl(34) synthesis GTPase MnmE [Deltaproteobacteria bacterium]
MNTQDTIVAPATAPGEGGIAIIRISGPDALKTLQHIFLPSGDNCPYRTHHLYHGQLVDSSCQPIDEVLVVYMAAPRTYTRDDVVEIHSHGSQAVVKKILNTCQLEGLRLAKPGEFTYRAYINGRLDLSQAEAVAKLISARTETSRALALAQVGGALSQKIHSFTLKIKEALVFIEAWIDFPEEDLPPENIVEISTKIKEIYNNISMIASGYEYGRLLSEGASIMLVGQPNVGKSSLLNSLLGEDRAIVTSVPGTTRDLIEEGVSIDGLPVRLIDTAGLRETEDIVELEGIRRAKGKMLSADLVLLLVDSSKELNEQDFFAQEQCFGLPTLVVMTKVDLNSAHIDRAFTVFPIYDVSTKTGQGLKELKNAIFDFLGGDKSASSESVLLTERRHYESLLFSMG